MTLLEQIERDEGGRQRKLYYVDGVPHIGVGHNLRDRAISDAAVSVMFEADVQETVADVRRLLPWAEALGEVRFAALVNMAFQMGVHGVLGFRRALAAMQAGDWRLAQTHLLDSRWAREQTPDRAHRVAEQIATGTWI